MNGLYSRDRKRNTEKDLSVKQQQYQKGIHDSGINMSKCLTDRKYLALLHACEILRPRRGRPPPGEE